MRLTTANLDALRVGIQTAFQGALDQAAPTSGKIATEIPSTTKEERMAWLQKLPGVREWVGDRVFKNIVDLDYTIKNKRWEESIAIDRDDFDDDTLGIYTTLAAEMGDAAIGHREQLIFGQYKLGFTTNCFDGQFFFDTDHPILDANGAPTTFANTDGGAGAPWFLMCSKKRIKPVAWTNRRSWAFTGLTNTTDPNVFNSNELRFGGDARYNAGFTLPQLCWGSKQALNAANYEAARAAIMNMKGDHGRPLGLVPDLLLVSPTLEGVGLDIVNSATGAAGATNKWKGTAELMVSPWLA